MKKFFSIGLILNLLLIGCSTIPAPVAIGQDLQKCSTDKYRIVWSGDASTTATIAWDQINGKNPVVYYGTKDFDRDWQKYPYSQKYTRRTGGYQGMNTHFARLTKLEPDQVYYFIIKDTDTCGKRFWFRTAPDVPKAFTFIAGGDSKSGGTALQASRESNKMVAKLRPLFVVFNGDFCSGDGTNDEYWRIWLSDWVNLTTTKDGRMIPLIPVHGNHENGDKKVLNRLFNVPYQFENHENIYYSVSFGGDFFHFTALNSEIEEGGDQVNWMEEDLKTHQHYTFKAAGYHKPLRPHTAGKRENDYQYEQWAPLFNKYGLDISMDGDSHMSKITFPIRPSEEPGSHQGFIRDDAKGTMYIGEGSWGASYRDNNDDKPWTLRSGSFNQIKWIQVFPEINGQPAHMEIRTVITGTKDEEEGNIISHVDNVVALSEKNVFAIPENINLFAPEPYGAVITYPFHLQQSQR